MNIDEAFATTTVEKEYRRLVAHMELVRTHWDTIHAVKEYLANNQIDAARSVFDELTEDVRLGLWVAPSKGGVWTTEERKMIGPDR
jgi:hypothetical protein